MTPLPLLTGDPPVDPFLLLLLALGLEAVLGDGGHLTRRLPHPVRIIGGLINALDRKLNREERTPTDRLYRGVLTVLIVIAPCGAFGMAISWLSAIVPFGWMVELVLLISLLAQRGLYLHVRAVGRALATGGVGEGRNAVAHIVGRDVDRLDDHGVARAAIESCAENFSDAVVAPVFWYVVLGFPGIVIYKAVNTMDSMIGHRSPRYRDFGRVAARLDDAMNFFPARLAAAFIAVSALLQRSADARASARTAIRDAGKHRSINAGWPEGAMAGALGLALAGPRQYANSIVDDAWIGSGTARATVGDIARALSLYRISCLINAALVAALAFLNLGNAA